MPITPLSWLIRINCWIFFSRNGGYITSPSVGRFCGNRIFPVIRSDSNQILVYFRSDDSLSAPGFEIFWDGTTIGITCKFVILNFVMILYLLSRL